MPIILRKIAPWLIAVLACAALIYGAKEYGYQQGVAATHAQQLADAKQTLDELKLSATAVNAASFTLGQTIANWQSAGDNATRSIKNALKQTADQRINCVLPVNVMRDLEVLRQRANAAAAGGINDTVPTAPNPSG